MMHAEMERDENKEMMNMQDNPCILNFKHV
jgi:hypothetical protein